MCIFTVEHSGTAIPQAPRNSAGAYVDVLHRSSSRYRPPIQSSTHCVQTLLNYARCWPPRSVPLCARCSKQASQARRQQLCHPAAEPRPHLHLHRRRQQTSHLPLHLLRQCLRLQLPRPCLCQQGPLPQRPRPSRTCLSRPTAGSRRRTSWKCSCSAAWMAWVPCRASRSRATSRPSALI